MKKYLRIAGYLVAVLFFGVALSGCTKKASTTVSKNIVVWSFEDEDVWKPIEKSFVAANKGYTMTYVKQTLDANYENKVLNSMLSGEGPDVWSMPSEWIYRHKEKLYPMPAKTLAKLKLDDSYVPVVKQAGYFDNNLYALSPSAEPLIVYYNSTMFQQALTDYDTANAGTDSADKRQHIQNILSNVPSTWTDFTDAIPLLTKKNGTTITQAGAAIGTDNITHSADILYLLMLQDQTDITSSTYDLATFNLPKGTVRQTSDIPGKQALDFYTSFSNPTSANYTWNEAMGNDVDAFVNGKVAMIFGYDDLQTYLAQKYPDFKYQKGSVPQLGSDSTQFVDYARFNAFGVNVLSPNRDIAWNAITALTDSSNSDFNSAEKLYTSQKSTSYDITLANRISNNPEKLELATAQTVVRGRYPNEFDNYIKDMIYAVVHNVQDSQSALDLAAHNITDILRKTTW